MHHRQGQIPRGVWAIGSELEDVAATLSFLHTAEVATAVTLRRPQGGHGAALGNAQAMTAAASFVALHGHADVATAAGAQAVIAGFRSLPLALYREKFPHLLLGASTHTEEEVDFALAEGADFLIFGPIWSTPEKEGVLKARGLELLATVCRRSIPVIAIGGIRRKQQAAACRQAGAHAVAVLRAARDAAQMQELAAAFL